MVPNTSDRPPDRPPPGRKRKLETFSFATLVVVLLIVSIATTITNLVIIYKLRLVPGFEFFTFSGDNVIFNRDTYIEKIRLGKSKISRLSTITGNLALESGTSSVRLNRDGIQVYAKHGFEVRTPDTGQLLYPFDFNAIPLDSIKTLSVPSGVRDVKLIRSPIEEDLKISAKERVKIRGNQGVRIDGKRITIDASSIFLSSLNSSIILDAQQGIYLNMSSFRKPVLFSNDSVTTSSRVQYKLCVCGRNGQLFRMAIKDRTTSCADARFPRSDNPCLVPDNL